MALTNSDDKFVDRCPELPRWRQAVYKMWWSWGGTKRLKARRLAFVNRLLGGVFDKPGSRILEVGCGSGKDFISHVTGKGLELHGVDIYEPHLDLPDFTFTRADAASLPFEDAYFDAVVSFGLLEHLSPVETLCTAASEIRRVAKSYCVIVPSISTFVEPHFWRPLWQLRRPNAKQIGTYYMSDAAWLNLKGFSGANSIRHHYIPGLLVSLMIYGRRERMPSSSP